ncbi:hypothetical protein HDU90_001056 [Geranomyces variabilis]|nr:hypothetical protein HDU90_001056 [Geranomyces variabilis]
MWGHRTEATVTAEVSGTLRPSIVYRLSVGFYGGFAIVHHSFAEISDLLKIPQETVIDWLTTAFPYLLEHDFDADFSLPLGSLQEEGWDETVRYRNAMQKLAHSGGKILEAFALLDRLTPRYECDIRGFWKSLRRKIGRLHGTVRAKGFAPVYEAFCTQNENTLAEEAARQIDAMSWIAESVLFTKCQLYDRLHGIDYCIDAGHPLEAEFCLLKPTHAGNSWHSPTFFIEVIDYSSPHDDPEHALTLSTSWSFDESSSDTQADKCLTKICKISPKAQSLSPDAMCVDKTFLHALWRYSRVTSKMID